jgi:hypothetical protein
LLRNELWNDWDKVGQVNLSSSSEIGALVGGINSSRSPLSEASPTQNLSIESPIQVLVLFFVQTVLFFLK